MRNLFRYLKDLLVSIFSDMLSLMPPPKMPELPLDYHVDELLINNEEPRSDPPRLPVPPSMNPLLKVMTLSSCMVDVAREELRQCAKLPGGEKIKRAYPFYGAGFVLWCMEEACRRLRLEMPVQIKANLVSSNRLYCNLLDAGAVQVVVPQVGDVAFWSFSGVAGIVVDIDKDRFKSVEVNASVSYERAIIVTHRVREIGLIGFIRLPRGRQGATR